MRRMLQHCGTLLSCRIECGVVYIMCFCASLVCGREGILPRGAELRAELSLQEGQ